MRQPGRTKRGPPSGWPLSRPGTRAPMPHRPTLSAPSRPESVAGRANETGEHPAHLHPGGSARDHRIGHGEHPDLLSSSSASTTPRPHEPLLSRTGPNTTIRPASTSGCQSAAWRPMIWRSSSVMSRANIGRGAWSRNTNVAMLPQCRGRSFGPALAANGGRGQGGRPGERQAAGRRRVPLALSTLGATDTNLVRSEDARVCRPPSPDGPGGDDFGPGRPSQRESRATKRGSDHAKDHPVPLV